MTTTHSIAELVAQNVATTLNGIRRAAGYELDILARRVQTIRKPLSPTNDSSGQTFDAEILIEQGKRERIDPTEYGKMNYRQTFALACVIYISEADAENILFDQRVNQVLAAIEKAMMADPQRGTHLDTANPLAINTYIGDSMSYVEDDQEGVITEVVVHYRTADGDPYSH